MIWTIYWKVCNVPTACSRLSGNHICLGLLLETLLCAIGPFIFFAKPHCLGVLQFCSSSFCLSYSWPFSFTYKYQNQPINFYTNISGILIEIALTLSFWGELTSSQYSFLSMNMVHPCIYLGGLSFISVMFAVISGCVEIICIFHVYFLLSA